VLSKMPEENKKTSPPESGLAAPKGKGAGRIKFRDMGARRPRGMVCGFISQNFPSRARKGEPHPHLLERDSALFPFTEAGSRLTFGACRNWCPRAAMALHFWFYDFARIHGSLRVTPAMEAGLTDHAWSLGELTNLLEPSMKKAA
jgi:hypothetical protein